MAHRSSRLHVDIQAELEEKREEIMELLADTDAVSSQEVISRFVSELFYGLAQKRQQEERRQKQAEGIAKAKAKGVRFGPAAKPLPEGFSECYQAWRSGELTQEQAAGICGISRAAFCRGVARMREAERCSV